MTLPRYPSDYWFVVWRKDGRILGEAHMPNRPPNAHGPILTVVHRVQHITYHITDVEGDLSVKECQWFAEQYHYGRTHIVRITVK
jgi:hypothetical protein